MSFLSAPFAEICTPRAPPRPYRTPERFAPLRERESTHTIARGLRDAIAAPLMPRNVSPAPKTSRFVLMASICVVVAALYFAQDVLIPLALAMLLSFLLAPLVNRLERWNLGRVPSVLMVVIVLFALICVLGYVVAMQIYDLADNVEQYQVNIISKIEALHPKGGGIFERSLKSITLTPP